MEKQTHFALFVNSLQKGGAERVMANLADYLVNRGHLVTLVTDYQKEVEYPLNPGAKRILSDITAVEVTTSRIINIWHRLKKLRRIWKSERPDIILSFIGENNLKAVMTSRFLKIPVVVSVRCAPHTEYPGWFRHMLANVLFSLADGVVYQTNDYYSFFANTVNRRAVVLRNPMNPLFFRPRYTGEREKVIVNTSRTVDYKNQRLLINAFARIADKFPDYKVIIYGDGDLRKILQEEVDELGLSERIFLPGISDRLYEDIYQVAIHVLTSDYEGSPNALIEAMLLGLPCIATDCEGGGPKELIEHGVNGLLTPMKDVEKMTENLQYLIENPQIAEQLGLEAHKIQSEFRFEKIAESWEQYLISKLK